VSAVTDLRRTLHTVEQRRHPTLLGPDTARKLYADPQFLALKAEVTRARKAILRATRPQQGRLFNAVGASIPVHEIEGRRKGKRKQPAVLLAHIVFGIEAQLLRTVVDAYANDVLLLQHDGWVSRSELDVGGIEDLIRERTGWCMALEKKQIEIPQELSFEKLFARNPMTGEAKPGSLAQYRCRA
jgi:hypothetical protein